MLLVNDTITVSSIIGVIIMPETILYQALDLLGYTCKNQFVEGDHVVLEIEPREERIRCPICGSHDVTKRGTKKRRIKTVGIGKFKLSILSTLVQRVHCKKCGIIRQIKLDFAEARRSYSKLLESRILEKTKYSTLTDTAKETHVGWNTCKNIEKRYLKEKYKNPDLTDLEYLAIDEISVRKGHKYLTNIMNLKTGKIIFVGDGKSADSVKPFFKKLPREKLLEIKAISIDLGKAYINAIHQFVPHAKIVFDHFHVVKLLNDKFKKMFNSLAAKLSDEDKQWLKGKRWLLLKSKLNLSSEKKSEINIVLDANKPLTVAYYLKEFIRDVWLQIDKASGARTLRRWIQMALNSGVRRLVNVGKLIQGYSKGILNWYDFRISSGRMEGLNNKIKTLKRQAYGYRDTEFFKLKILNIHDSRIVMVG